MARANSIILTKEDKKAKLAELNDGIKGAKTLLKDNAAAFKAVDKALVAANKEHAATVKTLTKEADKLAKDLALLEAQKSALVNEPVPTATAAPVVKRTRRTKAEMEAARAAAA